MAFLTLHEALDNIYRRQVGWRDTPEYRLFHAMVNLLTEEQVRSLEPLMAEANNGH